MIAIDRKRIAVTRAAFNVSTARHRRRDDCHSAV
jgi:hypothetical protein